MGTNYYWHKEPPCPHCGRNDEGTHIGKSSAGWCFSLHIYPHEGIADLPDWQEKWKTGVIKNEYDELVTADEMTRTITERGRGDRPKDFNYARNQAEPGPNNLLRHSIGRYCAGHGAGTWDLINGDFS